MNSAISWFSAAVVILVVTAGYVYIKNPDSWGELTSRAKKGIGAGPLMVIVVALAIAILGSLTGCAGTYGNYASMYVGLESTKRQSPQCEKGGPNDRITSNLGFRGNLYRSKDERWETNLKYTHHSCAFSPDDKSYDAGGVELDYKFLKRKR